MRLQLALACLAFAATACAAGQLRASSAQTSASSFRDSTISVLRSDPISLARDTRICVSVDVDEQARAVVQRSGEVLESWVDRSLRSAARAGAALEVEALTGLTALDLRETLFTVSARDCPPHLAKVTAKMSVLPHPSGTGYIIRGQINQGDRQVVLEIRRPTMIFKHQRDRDIYPNDVTHDQSGQPYWSVGTDLYRMGRGIGRHLAEGHRDEGQDPQLD